jgi:hypothetical protein
VRKNKSFNIIQQNIQLLKCENLLKAETSGKTLKNQNLFHEEVGSTLD